MVPDPGTGSMPPGFDQFTQIMGWGKWIALGVCVIALIVAAARMAISSRRQGDGSEHAGAIGTVLISVIVISAAFTLVSWLASP